MKSDPTRANLAGKGEGSSSLRLRPTVSLLRGIAMLRVLQPDSLYRRSGRCQHRRVSHRGAEAWSHLLAEPPSSPLLAPFATFSTSNRRHAASYQGMACKSHHDAKTWSHIYL